MEIKTEDIWTMRLAEKTEKKRRGLLKELHTTVDDMKTLVNKVKVLIDEVKKNVYKFMNFANMMVSVKSLKNMCLT